MKQAASHLLEIISLAIPLLQNFSEEEASMKPAPGKWSKKEIIGHLIDSACNNQQKFVRTITHKHVALEGYDQDHWVAAQQYNIASWQELIQFWRMYNKHIAHIISNIPPSCSHTISINGSDPLTLEFIINDYPEHLKHHLKAILPEADFLENNFKMVY